MKVAHSTRNATVSSSYFNFGHNRQVTEGFILVCLKGEVNPSPARVKYLREFGIPIKTEHECLILNL